MHTCALKSDFKSMGVGRLNTVQHEHRYLICSSFSIGNDLMQVTHPQTLVCERLARLAKTQKWIQRILCRAAGFTGMISICRITLPLHLQDFHLGFLSINIPLQEH